MAEEYASFPWNISSRQSRSIQYTFAPVELLSDTTTIEILTNDLINPTYNLILRGEGSLYSLDGSFNDPGYRLIASRLNENTSLMIDGDVTNIYYASDERNLYLGIECRVQNENNRHWSREDGIGILLNFSSQTGIPSGQPLGHNISNDYHFLNGATELSDGIDNNACNFTADFEVDYLFAVYSDGTPNKIIVDAATYVDLIAETIQNIGVSDQLGTPLTGPVSEGVFSTNSVQFAFQSSTGKGSRKGLEMLIPLSEVGADPSDTFEIFSGVVSSTAYFSNLSIPGDITAEDPGFNPDFYRNQIDVNCDCPNPGWMQKVFQGVSSFR